MTTLTLHTTSITKVLPEAPTPTYIVITIIMITRGLELSACCDTPDSTRLRTRLRQISSCTAVTVRLVRPWVLRMHNSHGQNRPPFISSYVSNTAPHTTAQHTTPATNTIAKRALADSIHLCCPPTPVSPLLQSWNCHHAVRSYCPVRHHQPIPSSRIRKPDCGTLYLVSNSSTDK